MTFWNKIGATFSGSVPGAAFSVIGQKRAFGGMSP
jgi:hypothetical protein